MNPMRDGKVDMKSLSAEEKKKLMYGAAMPKKNLPRMGRMKERKYFDSGDYALSKAGKGVDAVGADHPSPDSIPHHPVPGTTAGAPPLVSTAASGAVQPVATATGIVPSASQQDQQDQQSRPEPINPALAKSGSPQVARTPQGQVPTSPLGAERRASALANQVDLASNATSDNEE
ncbi:hypothetical protein GGF46_003241 [Coemansia sp. RSA 552]|nr:hypothetical protein GGF46_003241 [Coemansia sp. RSA 552]